MGSQAGLVLAFESLGTYCLRVLEVVLERLRLAQFAAAYASITSCTSILEPIIMGTFW
jgi:hypothetical protein